jgi:hypothetical protein
MFGCVCYPKLSAQATNKFPPPVHSLCLPRILHRSQILSVSQSLYQHCCLSTRFGEAVFPIAASPRLTNDLGIFPWDDAPSVAPIPDPLPEACIPPGFPPLAAAGG